MKHERGLSIINKFIANWNDKIIKWNYRCYENVGRLIHVKYKILDGRNPVWIAISRFKTF